jgi:ABC-type branched-subunit amino acid transport system substrate-binding protein
MFILISFSVMILLFSAAPARAEQGVTKNEILIGMSTVLSGPALFLGTNFRLGVEAYMRQVNDAGGVHGRKLRLIVYDDGYEPTRATTNVTQLIQHDKVFSLLGNVGTPTAVAIKPLLINEKVPLFAPFTGASSLRTPVSRYLLHYRASYNQEVEAFVEGMVDVLGNKKIAVFYQNDAYGMAVLDATKQALKKRDLEPVASGSYTRNFEDVYRAFDAILRAKPHAVVMAGTYSACAKFIMMWKRQYYLKGQPKNMNPVFMNVSFVGPDRLAFLLDKYGDNVVVTQVVPSLESDAGQYPAVTEYLSSMARYFPHETPTFVALEGFLATKVFVEILKRTGKELTREAFIDTAESIKNLDIKAGNLITFGADNHQGSQKV